MNRSGQALIATALVSCLAIYCATQVALLSSLGWAETPRDSDDALRLLSVRDLLNGQSWYDTVQHRVLPPEGLDLHWSRLIDAGLAGLTLVFRAIVPAQTAEHLSSYAWPALLFLCFLALTGWAAYVLRGAGATLLAMLAAALQPALVVFQFRVGRVDHHNLQILCILGAVAALVAVRHPGRSGVGLGVAAGLSLAVGLENGPVIGLLAGFLVVRLVQGAPGAAERLGWFSAAFLATAVVLFSVQTRPSLWSQTVCDQLGWPILFFPAVFLLYALLLPRLLQTRSLALAGITGAGAIWAFAAVFWGACPNGPYGVTADHAASAVIGDVLENRSLIEIASASPRTAMTFAVPVLIAIALPLVFRRRTPSYHLVVAILLAGLAGALLQVRLLIWSFAVVPLATGLGLHALGQACHGRFALMRFPLIILLLGIASYPALFLAGAGRQADGTSSASVFQVSDQNCFGRTVLEPLAGLPPALVFNPLNLGAPILFQTAHAVTSVPYHRSPEALANGVAPFAGSRTALFERLQATGARYVVVCRGQRYGPDHAIGTRLAAGEVIEGLADVFPSDQALRVLEVRE